MAKVVAEKLVRVYDLEAFAQKNFPKENFTEDMEGIHCGPWSEVVVIVGPKGAVVTCSEGVHQLIKPDDKEPYFSYDVYKSFKPKEDGRKYIACFPSWEGGIDVEDILKKCPFKRETRLTDFIRTFGSRLESNYALILNSISEIGLDPANYPRVDKTRGARTVPENN